MKKLVLIAGMASLGLAASALAGGPDYVAPASKNAVYVGAFGGVSVPSANIPSGYVSGLPAIKNVLKTGYDLGLNAGYRFSDFRAELQARYIRNAFKKIDKKAHFNLTTIMVNGYYDINLGSSFVPFVGAGIGYVHPTVSEGVVTKSDNDHFGYQGIVGVAYNVTKNISVDASYTYLGWTRSHKTDPKVHQNLINLGVNYYFS